MYNLVACDNEGIDAVQLEERIVKSKKQSQHFISEKKPFWGIIFLMTVNHNPTGLTYSEGKIFLLK